MDENKKQELIENLSFSLARFLHVKKPKGKPKFTPPQISFLISLTKLEKEKGKNNVNPSDISTMLSITRPAVTHAFHSLEKMGVVKRVLDENDKRKFKISLTPTGEETFNKGCKEMNNFFSQTINALGEDKTIQLINLLNEASSKLKGEDND